ncbi:hypothetical protein N8I77_005309 [Diaporthe amygdali]|uniref:Uncharacterized protein n=1 Tax=Phomopsis amygdali TaxID=1214568 RepID=A0AAD9SFW5_PHOAM|nr:hypothetical protein N8I77_005309 [Diaporthe amygdali]
MSTTWTYRHRDPKDKSKVTKEVNWLTDDTMLQNHFPKARTMTFGYDSVWYGKAPPKQSLKGIATMGYPDLPILLIGHCFGGLVLEQAYLSAKTLAADHPGIYDSVTGILFFGTPHRGSDMAHSPSLEDLYKLIACQKLEVQDDLLKTITQDNSMLFDTVHDFTRDLGTRSPSPKLFCFFEERKTAVGRIAGLENTPRELMVNEASGSLHGHEKTGWIVDHFEMNIFEDEEDKYFRNVADQIHNIMDVTGDIMKQRGALIPIDRNDPMLPYPVLKGFASQDNILAKIGADFEHTSKVCLVGPCGAGNENRGAKIYWVNTSDPAEFELSYQVIKREFKLNMSKKSTLMTEVCDYLKQLDSGNWLMTLAALSKTIQHRQMQVRPLVEYIPTEHPYGGRVLITTRSKALATSVVSFKYVVDVPAQLSKGDASQPLFGGKPTKRSASISTKYASKTADILENTPPGALALAFTYMSILGPDMTWKRLYEQVQATVLTKFDALELSVNRRDMRFIPMIRLCVLETMKENKDEALFLMEAVVELICEAYPAATFEDTIQCRTRKPSAMAALRLSVKSSQAHRKRAILLFKVDTHDNREKRYGSASKFLEECVNLCRIHKGDSHDLEKEAGKLLDDSNKAQRKSARRISKMKEEAATVPENAAGLRTRPMRKSSNIAAALHRKDEDSMKNNIKYFKQTLAWCQAKYGADHLEMDRQQYNLALSYDAHGQHVKAEKLYREAIATMKRMYGSGHSNAECLRIQGSLARMYCEQGRFCDAENTLKEVLRGQEELLWLDYPETLVTHLNVALVIQKLRPDDLDLLARDTENVLTAQSRLYAENNMPLAFNHRLNGRIEDAESLYKVALEVQRRILGDRYPDTRKTVFMLAELKVEAGRKSI